MSTKQGNNDVPLRKEGYPQVKGLIESIDNDRYSEPFLEPVDWESKSQTVAISRCMNQISDAPCFDVQKWVFQTILKS